MPRELFLTTGKKTKLRNVFANNISTDIKLSKAQISKITQSGRSFGSWLGNLGKKALTNVAILLARNDLPGLVSNLTSSAITKFDKKISGKEAFREVTFSFSFIYFIYFKWRHEWYYKNYNTIRIIGCINWWSYSNSKRWNKKTRRWIPWSFLAPLATSLVQLVVSSVLKSTSRRGVKRAGRRYTIKYF